MANADDHASHPLPPLPPSPSHHSVADMPIPTNEPANRDSMPSTGSAPNDSQTSSPALPHLNPPSLPSNPNAGPTFPQPTQPQNQTQPVAGPSYASQPSQSQPQSQSQPHLSQPQPQPAQPQPQLPQRAFSSASRRPQMRGPAISFHDPRASFRGLADYPQRPLSATGIRDVTTPAPALNGMGVGMNLGGLDYMSQVEVMKERERYRPKTVGERLEPTIMYAKKERETADARARRTGRTLNFAIGGQVLLGALTTAISAASPGRQTAIATSVLGGMATLIASYLARMRGSSEPDSSIRLTKDLDQFIRDIEAFVLDHGHETGYPPAHTLSTPSSPPASPYAHPAQPFPSENGGGGGEPYSASSATEGDDELKGKWDERIAQFRRRLDELLALGGAAGGGGNNAVGGKGV